MSSKSGTIRKFPRQSLLLKIDYQSAEELQSDYLTNLSEGGLFIRTDQPFRIGEKISFAISFPGLLQPITCHAIIRWCQAATNNQQVAGIGAEFIWDEITQQDELEQLIKQIQQPSTQKSRDDTYRVLLIEDNHVVIELLEHGVKKAYQASYGNQTLELESVSNGVDAWQHLKSKKYNLVIVDHYLPGMSGLEITKRMRSDENFKNVAIVMSSIGGQALSKQAIEAGADLFIEKPVLLNELVESLRLLVNLQLKA